MTDFFFIVVLKKLIDTVFRYTPSQLQAVRLQVYCSTCTAVFQLVLQVISSKLSVFIDSKCLLKYLHHNVSYQLFKQEHGPTLINIV